MINNNLSYALLTMGCTIILIASIIVIIVNVIHIVIVEEKTKKENKKMNIDNKTKIMLITASILIPMSIIGQGMVNYFKMISSFGFYI